MHFHLYFIFLCALFVGVNGWWMWGKKGKDKRCPKRNGAQPYYFGSTNLKCMIKEGKKGKRSAPARGIWDLKHRFIEYRGHYFDFLDNSKVYISKRRLQWRKCSGGKEGSPAGHSELSLNCIIGCAKNYKCRYGKYRFLKNNCNKFANRLSKVLCRRGKKCPSWCEGSCNNVVYNYVRQ
ncbi:uncharacterized protein LOC125659389 [Ostrea edulis]|uniref:uncharacterized protein LOC125659389 n=1 Tax=Ostrea edulis TaxID=37623 RepID=UPI002094088B|nr:uncharacterized protein LOC125659389 [Ostrea edulis]